MTQRNAYREGLERGRVIASWSDVPRVGEKIPRDIDWVGYDVVDAENFLDVWTMYCAEAEGADRQYSPFECTASAFNAEPNAEALWEAFDAGIERGIEREIWRRIDRAVKGSTRKIRLGRFIAMYGSTE